MIRAGRQGRDRQWGISLLSIVALSTCDASENWYDPKDAAFDCARRSRWQMGVEGRLKRIKAISVSKKRVNNISVTPIVPGHAYFGTVVNEDNSMPARYAIKRDDGAVAFLFDLPRDREIEDPIVQALATGKLPGWKQLPVKMYERNGFMITMDGDKVRKEGLDARHSLAIRQYKKLCRDLTHVVKPLNPDEDFDEDTSAVLDQLLKRQPAAEQVSKWIAEQSKAQDEFYKHSDQQLAKASTMNKKTHALLHKLIAEEHVWLKYLSYGQPSAKPVLSLFMEARKLFAQTLSSKELKCHLVQLQSQLENLSRRVDRATEPSKFEAVRQVARRLLKAQHETAKTALAWLKLACVDENQPKIQTYGAAADLVEVLALRWGKWPQGGPRVLVMDRARCSMERVLQKGTKLMNIPMIRDVMRAILATELEMITRTQDYMVDVWPDNFVITEKWELKAIDVCNRNPTGSYTRKPQLFHPHKSADKSANKSGNKSADKSATKSADKSANKWTHESYALGITLLHMLCAVDRETPGYNEGETFAIALIQGRVPTLAACFRSRFLRANVPADPVVFSFHIGQSLSSTVHGDIWSRWRSVLCGIIGVQPSTAW